MPTQTPERLIRPFLLYGGLVFTIAHRAVLVGMILLFLHLFVVTIVPVKGASMDPTLKDGTYLLVNELTPYFRPLKRGEIVAFRYPADPKEKFIKRTIGLPGDAVTVKDGHVFVQRPGDPEPIQLREPYLPFGRETSGTITLSPGSREYVVLGDNRPVSLDSRFIGTIPDANMIGRAWMAIWPLTEFRLISHFDPITASQ